jgi:hypothetical protein
VALSLQFLLLPGGQERIASEMTGSDRDRQENKHKELARDILAYLCAYNGATDTLEGIAHWWLLREWAERRLHDVERAIALLVDAGLVVKRVQVGQEPRYGMNVAKRDEIKRVLQEWREMNQKREK